MPADVRTQTQEKISLILTAMLLLDAKVTAQKNANCNGKTYKKS